MDEVVVATGFRPELEATDEARAAARFLLLEPPLPWPARPGYGLIASGGVAVLPRWARRALRLPVDGPLPALAGGAGRVGTRAVRWASNSATSAGARARLPSVSISATPNASPVRPAWPGWR